MPSTPYDVKGLLRASSVTTVRSCSMNRRAVSVGGAVPDEDYTVPLGVAEVKREGRDVTVVALGAMVPRALAVAATLAREGVSVEVVDPRTLRPLDTGTLVESARKTGRVVIVHEANVLADSAAKSPRCWPTKRSAR